MSRRLGLVLACLSATPRSWPAGPGAAAAGTGVRTSWLSGLTIHNRGVPDQHVSLPQSHAATTYLLGGIDGGGWVLLDDRGRHTALYTLRNGGPHRFRRVDDSEDGHSFLLAPDGRSVAEVDAPTTSAPTSTPTACPAEGCGTGASGVLGAARLRRRDGVAHRGSAPGPGLRAARRRRWRAEQRGRRPRAGPAVHRGRLGGRPDQPLCPGDPPGRCRRPRSTRSGSRRTGPTSRGWDRAATASRYGG